MTLTTRLNGDAIDASWFNDIKTEVEANDAAVNAELPFFFRRNYVPNGNFALWRYATSQSSGTTGYGSTDFWTHNQVGGTRVVEQISGINDNTLWNTKFSCRTDITVATSSAGDYVQSQVKIPGANTLSNKSCTLFFHASHSAGSVSVSTEVRQQFGSGGSATVSVDVTKTAITTSSTGYVVNFNMPSVSGKTIGTDDYIELTFWFSAGSTFNSSTDTLGHQSGQFVISNVQLFEGTLAVADITSYRYREGSERNELRLAKSWYNEIDSTEAIYFSFDATNTATYYSSWAFPEETRTTTPTVTFTRVANNSVYSTAAPTLTSRNSQGFIAEKDAIATGSGYFSYTYKMNDEL